MTASQRASYNELDSVVLGSVNRMNARQPKLTKNWLKYGLSEFVGSFIFCFTFVSLFIYVPGGHTVEEYFGHDLFIGMFEGFLKAMLIILLMRWSSDINPSVTIYKMLTGRNTTIYGIWKLTAQLTAGILAGILGGLIANATRYGTEAVGYEGYIGTGLKVVDIGGIKDHFHFEDVSNWVAFVIVFFTELCLTMLWVWPVFSKQIPDANREFMIILMVGLGGFVGRDIGSSAMNPARALAQNIPGLVWGESISHMESLNTLALTTIIIFTANILAPLNLIYFAKTVHMWLNPLFHRIINYKNRRFISRRSSEILNTQEIKRSRADAKVRTMRKMKIADDYTFKPVKSRRKTTGERKVHSKTMSKIDKIQKENKKTKTTSKPTPKKSSKTKK